MLSSLFKNLRPPGGLAAGLAAISGFDANTVYPKKLQPNSFIVAFQLLTGFCLVRSEGTEKNTNELILLYNFVFSY